MASRSACERGLVEPAVVEHLAVIEAGHRARGVLGACPGEPVGGGVEVAAGLLRQPELEHRRDVARLPREERLELGDRVGMAAQGGMGPAELPARVAILGVAPDALPQVGDPAVVVPALAVGDVEVALRHLHPRIELQRADELGDRVLDQPLLIVENAEVVVGAGVGGIDPAGKGAQDGEIALRQHGTGHRLRSGGWRRRWPAATACRAGAGSGRGAARWRPPPGTTSRRRRRSRGRGRSSDRWWSAPPR